MRHARCAAARYGDPVPGALDLLVVGDANPDLVLTGDITPRFGQVEQLVDAATLVLGGSGAITACGAARLGLQVAFIGVVGDDLFGRFSLDALTERGVDTSGCRTDASRSTGLTVILSGGEDRAILTAAGTMGDLRSEHIDLDLLRSARHVHVSSYYLQTRLAPGLGEVFEQAHATGATTSIDPNFDPAEQWDSGLRRLLAHTDYLLPNATEVRAIAGTADLEAATLTLTRLGRTVAVKLGAEGALAMSGAEVVRARPIATSVVDTIGAGDSFDAGFLTGLLRGWPLDRCLRLAVACGSLSTRRVGGTAGQPTMEEALAALPP